MRISPVQNYNYANSKNLNSTTKQSPSFGELHFSQELREFFRVKNIPLEPLQTVKNNTKDLSENMLRRCIEDMQDRICDVHSQVNDVIDICRAVSREKYGLVNQEIMKLAQSEQVAKICREYANKVQKEAWEIFAKYGKDFDFEVYDLDDNRKAWEDRRFYICYEIPGLCSVNDHYSHKENYFQNILTKFKYFCRDSKSLIISMESFKSLPDSSSDLAKDLTTTFALIKEDFQNAVHEQISTMAEQIVQNDNYETLK